MSSPELMVLLAGIIAMTIGYLAQSLGLCLVRGVHELLEGHPSLLAALLSAGLWSWLAVLGADLIGQGPPFLNFSANAWFAFGGLLFGLGAAMNRGCGISTLNRLARGDLPMMATIGGWIAGWYLMAYWPHHQGALIRLEAPGFTLPLLLAGSLAISLWALFGDPRRRQLWFGVAGLGLLAGLLFAIEPAWAPSRLLEDATLAFTSADSQWPSSQRQALMAALLCGMAIAAWRGKTLGWRRASLSGWAMHLTAGLLMGIGGAMAMGGNDTQLLLALPVISPAGLLTVAAMIVGIVIATKAQRYFRATSIRLTGDQ